VKTIKFHLECIQLGETVTLAEAGGQKALNALDSRFRGNDNLGVLQSPPTYISLFPYAQAQEAARI
jgi:hypothetical protein